MVVDVLRSGEPTALLLGNAALGTAALVAASSIANTVDAKLFCETFPPRVARGAGIPEVERIAYLGEMAVAQLEGIRHLVLIDAKAPVSFFAYPERPSSLVPENCEIHVLAGPADDVTTPLEALADEVGARPDAARLAGGSRPDLPTGELNVRAVAAAVGALLPEGAIVSDEGNTSGLFASSMTAGCPPHDWLFLSALYTLQAWWTMARYGLDVTTVLFNNHSYAILNMELQRVGTEGAGDRAREMLDLSNPDIDFASLARGMGLTAWRSRTAEEFSSHLAAALNTPGPSMVEAILPTPG